MERLVDRVVSIETTIEKNKFDLLKTTKDPKSEGSELKDLKNLAAILSQLYITNQVRGGDKLEFFLHENFQHTSSICKDGELYHGSK